MVSALAKCCPPSPEKETVRYEKVPFTVENAAIIPCTQMLGAYLVSFER